MKNIIFLLLLFICTNSVINQPSNNWILQVKNELGNDEPIIFKGGIYTIVTFIITNEDGNDYLDRSFDNSTFEIFLNDSNFITAKTSYNIIPSESLEYFTYIGLNCENNITESNYTLQFSIKENAQLKENIGSLTIKPISVSIDHTKTIITLEPIETNIALRVYSYFRLKDNLYNIKEINIKSENKDENNYYYLNTIRIKPFDIDNEFPYNKRENNEIISNEYGTNLIEYDDNYNNFTFNLMISGESENKCFTLNEECKKLTLTLKNEEVVPLNISVETAFFYNMEAITPKFDDNNNIQIKIYIPVAPIIIQCRVKCYEAKMRENSHMFYVANIGDYIMKFDDLLAGYEYQLKCTVGSLNYKKLDYFNFDVGIYDNNNFVTSLVPSRDINRISQCAEFNFVSDIDELNLKRFYLACLYEFLRGKRQSCP